MLSPSDTAIVFLLALLLFGPEQLPRIARQLGEAMRHIQTTTHSFMNEMERAARTDDATAHVPYSKDGEETQPHGIAMVEPPETPAQHDEPASTPPA